MKKSHPASSVGRAVSDPACLAGDTHGTPVRVRRGVPVPEVNDGKTPCKECGARWCVGGGAAVQAMFTCGDCLEGRTPLKKRIEALEGHRTQWRRIALTEHGDLRGELERRVHGAQMAQKDEAARALWDFLQFVIDREGRFLALEEK